MKPHAAFGGNLRRLRHRRGYDRDGGGLRALAQAMRDENDGDALGLDHSELSRIENGKRQVTIEQWLLIAAALDCPPLLLIVPLGEEDRIDVTARSSIHPHAALRWIMGEREHPLMSTERRGIRRGKWLHMRRPLELYERLARAQDLVRPDQAHSPLSMDEARRVYAELAEVLSSMAEADVMAPALGPWVVGRLAQLGYHPDALGVHAYTPDDWYADWGTPTPMRHPALLEPVDIPAELVEDYRQSGGWTEVGS